MRGKAEDNAPRLRCTGITPAYAGKSVTGVGRRTLDEDHPRLCGEKYYVCKHKG